jgi:hypothetical protein
MIKTEMKTILRRQTNRWGHYVDFGGVVDFRRATSKHFELIGPFHDPGKYTLNHDVMDYARDDRQMLHICSLA